MSGRNRRKLAAILAADVVAYSRMMEADELGTLARLKATRAEVVDPAVAEYGGHIVKTTGDGFLCEFDSAVDAVQCAVAMQAAMAARLSNGGADGAMQFRMGIHLGDIVIGDDDIYGDGVNIAARLEGIADPGGVCISGTTRDTIRGHPIEEFADDGKHTLKNIVRPIQVWRWRPGPTQAKDTRGETARGSADRPSIAVLPFDSMSGDQEQAYFVDGITEDLITELSRYRELFVIARNTTFQYKGRSVDVTKIAEELHVRYVLEGSVRKAGNRIRITAQLIAAESGGHIWAERYDRDLSDIFAVQDEVVRSIVAALPARVEAADLERTKRKTPVNLMAYDYLLRAKDHHHRVTEQDNARAIELLDKAIELDPDYANAYAWLACTYGQAFVCGFLPWSEQYLARCEGAAETAYKLDSEDSEAHRVLSAIRLIQGRYDEAWHHHERALALNPNDARIVSQRGELLTWFGKPEEGIEWIENAMRLDPSGSERRAVYLGRAAFVAGRFQEALDAFGRGGRDTHEVHALRAACLAALGRDAETREAVAEVLRLKPDFSIETFLAVQPFRDNAVRERCAELLAAADLPR